VRTGTRKDGGARRRGIQDGGNPAKKTHTPHVSASEVGARIFSTVNQNNFFNRSLQNEVDLTSVT